MSLLPIGQDPGGAGFFSGSCSPLDLHNLLRVLHNFRFCGSIFMEFSLVLVCSQRADIAFMVDASKSVKLSGFRRSKEFIKAVLQRFKVSQTNVHVGLILFSTRAKIIFNFEEHYTKNDLNAAIDAMEWTKGSTYTDRALKLAREQLFVEKENGGTARADIPKFLVVMTDGISRNPTITAKEAAELKKRGVHIVVVGVGFMRKRSELLSIASSRRAVITARSFKTLKTIVAVTKEKVCGGEY